MTLAEFAHLPYPLQLAALDRGRRLLTRRPTPAVAVHLFWMPGNFFAEVAFDTVARRVRSLWALPGRDRLEDYAAAVRLPDWLRTL